MKLNNEQLESLDDLIHNTLEHCAEENIDPKDPANYATVMVCIAETMESNDDIYPPCDESKFIMFNAYTSITT